MSIAVHSGGGATGLNPGDDVRRAPVPLSERIPLPGPVGPDPIPEHLKKYARDAFVMSMLFGEEEETGVPPLSVEI